MEPSDPLNSPATHLTSNLVLDQTDHTAAATRNHRQRPPRVTRAVPMRPYQPQQSRALRMTLGPMGVLLFGALGVTVATRLPSHSSTPMALAVLMGGYWYIRRNAPGNPKASA